MLENVYESNLCSLMIGSEDSENEASPGSGAEKNERFTSKSIIR